MNFDIQYSVRGEVFPGKSGNSAIDLSYIGVEQSYGRFIRFYLLFDGGVLLLWNVGRVSRNDIERSRETRL